jgi:hypothetical protein
MDAPSLTELANRYGSDKGTEGPSLQCGAHNYTDIYEAYLGRHRYSAISLLEIGLGVLGDRWNARIVQGRNTGGASIKMWHDYFPNAKIFGIDINACPYLDNERLKTFVADQSNPAELENFMKAAGDILFDVIIDDGSHLPHHQQISLSFFFKRLKSGGHYFIEDLGRNGLGDAVRGKPDWSHVRNTRSVLRQFGQSGKFLEPNALTDTAYLAQHIADIHFHVPKRSTQLTLGSGFRRPFRLTVGYKPDTEQLCAIRKK